MDTRRLHRFRPTLRWRVSTVRSHASLSAPFSVRSGLFLSLLLGVVLTSAQAAEAKVDSTNPASAHRQDSGALLTGGNGTHYSLHIDVTVRYITGCRGNAFTSHPNPGDQSPYDGQVWLSGGVLNAEGPAASTRHDYTGTLRAGGAFHLELPSHSANTFFRVIDGRISPDGRHITGTTIQEWFGPECDAHGDITDGHVLTVANAPVGITDFGGTPKTQSRGGTTGGSAWPWIAGGLAALLAAIAAGVTLARRRRACDCTASAAIVGRNPLRVCDCQKVTWSLEPWKPEPGSLYASARPDRNVTLVGTLPDGAFYCRRRYEVSLQPNCRGGGAISQAGPATWELASGSAGLTLKCSVPAKIRCPGEPDRSTRCEGQHAISFAKAPCRISFLIEEDHFWRTDTGHTSMRIQCGEFDKIVGFRAQVNGLARVSAAAGAAFKGSIDDYSACFDDKALYTFGHDLSGIFVHTQVQSFTVEGTCEACSEIRAAWRDLARKPGDWQLYNNNCTTMAIRIGASLLNPLQRGAVNLLLDSVTVAPFMLAEFFEAVGYKPEVFSAPRPRRYKADPTDPFDDQIEVPEAGLEPGSSF